MRQMKWLSNFIGPLPLLPSVEIAPCGHRVVLWMDDEGFRHGYHKDWMPWMVRLERESA